MTDSCSTLWENVCQTKDRYCQGSERPAPQAQPLVSVCHMVVHGFIHLEQHFHDVWTALIWIYAQMQVTLKLQASIRMPGWLNWLKIPLPVSLGWELYAVVFATAIWAHPWSGKKVLFHCDNLAVCYVLCNKTSKSPTLMDHLRKLFYMVAY